MAYESVLVVLATGGASLERDALDALPETTVTWSRIEREGAWRVWPPASVTPTPFLNSESESGNGLGPADGV